MATSAGSIVVDLDANSIKLLRELQKASRKTKTTSQNMQRHFAKAFKSIARLSARLGPALAVGFTALAAAGIKSADQLAKTATKLGLAANELAGLQFAAQQTGVSVETLNMALQRMVRRVAEAAVGTGEAKGALKELGLDAKELARQSPDEQFRMIAEAMEKVTSQGHKVRLGMKLFDSEGVALVNTLEGGRDALEAFRAESERLGLALTSGQLKQIEKAADAQGRVTSAFKGLSQQLASHLAPAMKWAADKTTRLSAITKSLPGLTAYAAVLLDIERNIEGMTTAGMTAEIQLLDKAINDQQGTIFRQRKELRNLNEETRNMTDAELMQLPVLVRQQAELDRLTTRYNELIRSRLKLKRADSDASDGGPSFFAKLTPTADQLQRLTDAKTLFDSASKSLSDFNAEQDRIAASGESIFKQTRTDIEKFTASMIEAKKALDKGVLQGGIDTFQRYRRMLKEQLIPDLESLDESTKSVTDNMSSYADQAARNMQDAFAEFFFDPFDKGLKGMVEGFLNAIRTMLANQLALQAMSGIKGWLGKLGAAAAGGGGGGGGGTVAGFRASGGPVTRGRPYVVGERGPELFIPGASGSIMANASGGTTNNYYFEAGADIATIEARIVPMLERTENNSVQRVVQMRGEGKL